MKRALINLSMLLVVLFLFTGCPSGDPEVNGSNNSVTGEKNVDIEKQIIEESIESEGVLGAALSENVKISTAQPKDGKINVFVKAPYIYDELYAWFDSLSDEEYSDKALEDKIIELLGSEKKDYSFTLEYELTDGVPVISYTPEYYDAVSCGISNFYAQIFDDSLSEIEASLGGE